MPIAVRVRRLALGVLFGLFAAIPSWADPEVVTTSTGLGIVDQAVGEGAQAQAGDTCVVHYTGWLYPDGAKGKKFDSSVDRGTPFEFELGRHRVIRGWEEGVTGMRVGGKRSLIIPPALGYGARGYGSLIPPNSTLIFDVELLKIDR